MEALEFCAAHGIGSFRIQSQILPLKTHPQAGYRIEELPEAKDDYIDPKDFPAGWLMLRLTIEVEAKELAARKLERALSATARFVP